MAKVNPQMVGEDRDTGIFIVVRLHIVRNADGLAASVDCFANRFELWTGSRVLCVDALLAAAEGVGGG